jgi:hypothetical protein
MFKTFQYPDHIDSASTIRPSEGAYFLLNSNDRYPQDSNSGTNFYDDTNPINPNNILISKGKQYGAGAIKRIAITNINFPFTTPNINVNNNRFYISAFVGGTLNTYFIIVPEGFYSGSALATAMTNQMNKASGGYGWFTLTNTLTSQGALINSVSTWTVVFNGAGSFTISNSSSLNFSPDTTSTGTFISSNLSVSNGTNIVSNGTSFKTINLLSGFNYGFLAPLASSATGGIASLCYTRYIDFVSATLCKFQDTKDSQSYQFNTDIIYRLYLDATINLPAGQTSYFCTQPCINMNIDVTNPKFMKWNPNEYLTSIDIQLIDDMGNPLYIPNVNWGSNYLITFLMLDS